MPPAMAGEPELPPEMGAEAAPEELPPEMTEGAPEELPPEMAGGAPEELPPEMAEGMPEELPPEGMPEGLPPEGMSEELPPEMPPAMQDPVEGGDPERQLELLSAVEPALSEMNDMEFSQMMEQLQALGMLAAQDEAMESPEEKVIEEETGQEMPPPEALPPEVLKEGSVKLAQPPMPPAMEGGGAPPMPPEMAGGAPPMPPEAAAPPMPPPEMPSATDQAFQETMEGLQGQMDNLQSMLQVLQMVQTRAMEIEQSPEAGGAPMPPEAGGAPPMPPGAGGGGEMPMQGMPPGMAPEQGMAPGAEQQQAPPLPVMKTEMPSEQEIASQVNPTFLEQAGQFSDMGAFDAGAVSSLSQNSSLKNIASQYSANLEDSVDDLGRTLLTLYMQEGELKEQIGDEAFVELEEQLRNTFKGLGELVLNLSHHTSVIDQPNVQV